MSLVQVVITQILLLFFAANATQDVFRSLDRVCAKLVLPSQYRHQTEPVVSAAPREHILLKARCVYLVSQAAMHQAL